MKILNPEAFFVSFFFSGCSFTILREDLTKVSEEEELCMRKEETERLSELRAKITSEVEAEKEKLRQKFYCRPWRHKLCWF